MGFPDNQFTGPRLLQEPVELATGEAANFDCRGCMRLVVMTDAGCTATIERLPTKDATAGDAGYDAAVTDISVAADTLQVTDVDWPFYRVGASGGSCTVSVV